MLGLVPWEHTTEVCWGTQVSVGGFYAEQVWKVWRSQFVDTFEGQFSDDFFFSPEPRPTGPSFEAQQTTCGEQTISYNVGLRK
jgi:hypothetical protein